MSLSRRQLLTTGALAMSTPLLTGRHAAATTPAVGKVAPAHGGLYSPNAAPLAPTSFLRLPPGTVRARGWLAGQLKLQLNGLCGQYEKISHFLDFNETGWVHPEKEGWEEVTYWLRGYVALAIATRDEAALNHSERWIDAILATEQDDGFFGPRRLRTSLNGGPDFWPFLPLLMALRSWQEYRHDDRIVPVMSRFTRFMNAQGKGAFDTSWVSFRWGDGLDVVQWLYNRTGEEHLLELCDKMHRWGADWTGTQLPSPHNVDIAQGFREPAQYALRSGDSRHTRATYRAYTETMREYGQFPGGGFAGDERQRPGFGDPRQGFETCGIVEFMASHELLTRITGDPLWADRCEDLAFNMLPASLDPQGTGIHYVTGANSIDLGREAKTQGQFQNGFAMQTYQPGVDNYRCCPHNYGMGWPYFTEELWMATPDRGLAAVMYAASEVTAKVADGTEVTFREDTDYPFSETVTLTLGAPGPVAFPLRLRIPAWCENPSLTVNGRPAPSRPGPAFVTVDRTWADGDTVTLRLPQRTTLRTWKGNGDAVSVDHGPLTYSLRIGEEYVRYAGDTTFPEYEVHATTPWNFGLALDPQRAPGRLELRRKDGPLADNPFTHEGTPVHLTAPARRVAQWSADSENVVNPLQPSPAHSDAPEETVTLIPMGAARLRITAFPTVSPSGRAWREEPPYHRVRNSHSGKVLAVDGMSLEEGGRIVQFDNSGTGDHAWQFLARDGADQFVIRNGYTGKILGIENHSSTNGARIVQYEDEAGTDPRLLWKLENADADSGGKEGPHRIVHVRTGKVLGVEGQSTQNSAQVVLSVSTGADDQLWKLV
ncbi:MULTISPECIES: beta-L-arabinofuranosidase domain-containing protein [Streptomyces]|uniref:beta-L-arabinofuranosidase domain-containing protein n=1 Tax=Streptomyces TaxID=1883 RepID=UPI0004C8D65B|nr:MULTISPECIES: beta-L-arabinofuranosidase domain-containing protein [Streptomyces]